MVGLKHIIYGADCGVPCSTNATMAENQKDVLEIERQLRLQGAAGSVARNDFLLFPAAARRAEEGQRRV